MTIVKDAVTASQTAWSPSRTRRSVRRPAYGTALRRRLRGADGNAQAPVTGIVGGLVFLVAFLWWPKGALGSEGAQFFLFIGVIAGAMIVTEVAWVQSWRAPDAAIRWPGTSGIVLPSRDDTVARFVAVVMVAGLSWLYFTVVPLYRQPWYARLVDPFRLHVVGFALALALYVMLVSLISTKTEDAWLALGRVVLGRGAAGDRAWAGELLGNLLVKLFFLPLMLGFALGDWHHFYTTVPHITSFRDLFDVLFRLFFFCDVVFALIGYGATSRLLNSHSRWPERTFSGWVFCLVCYVPFWQVIGRDLLHYGDGITWGTLVPENSFTYDLWGTIILLLVVFYLSSTLSFGLRFSNLTYRGTIAHGPYVLLRHPAYVAKNLAWWFIDVPFIAHEPRMALANTCALLGVNLVYFARARHEEACCGRDPHYRLYSRYVRRYSPLLRPARAVGREICLLFG